MKTAMLGLLAETPIHPGTGRSMGVVDLPVAREAATDYPVLVASSLKGALRDKAETTKTVEANDRFGKPDHAGDLLVSDGRLLLLPVRSLTGSYRWVTCPHIIERYRRDLSRTGLVPQQA
jgi:CRISPR-associated protein Cmr4